MDFQFDKTMNLLSSMMDFRSQRHQLITSNIANIDTPGYTSKDLQFKGIIGEAMQKKLATTDKRHFSGQFANAGSIDCEVVGFRRESKYRYGDGESCRKSSYV